MTLRLATTAMATRFELVLAGGREAWLRAAGEAALAEIEACHQELSRFRAGSLVSWLGRRAARGPVRIGDELFELLAECHRVWRASGGAFDVTLAARMRALGFWAPECNPPAARAVSPLSGVEVGGGGIPLDEPARSRWRSFRQESGMAAWRLDPEARTVAFDQPLELDLGAIGKGHALDRAGDVLREAGVPIALVHGGTSSVLAIGAPPGSDAWRVRVGPAASHTARLRDAALGVSAPSGRSARGPDGEALGHVLDPATGLPASGQRLAAVIAPTAQSADAWSTALVAGGLAAASGLPSAATALVAPRGGAPPRVLGAAPFLFEPCVQAPALRS